MMYWTRMVCFHSVFILAEFIPFYFHRRCMGRAACIQFKFCYYKKRSRYNLYKRRQKSIPPFSGNVCEPCACCIWLVLMQAKRFDIGASRNKLQLLLTWCTYVPLWSEQPPYGSKMNVCWRFWRAQIWLHKHVYAWLLSVSYGGWWCI